MPASKRVNPSAPQAPMPSPTAPSLSPPAKTRRRTPPGLPEGEADAHLLRPGRDRVGDDSVEPDARERQSQPGENCEQGKLAAVNPNVRQSTARSSLTRTSVRRRSLARKARKYPAAPPRKASKTLS